MEEPAFDTILTMSQSTFKVYFDPGDSGVGAQLPPSSTLHRLVCAITRRVFAALRTDRAGGALRSIAEQWSAHHHHQLDPAKAVQDFQSLVANARQHNHAWANVIVRWKCPGMNGGCYRLHLPTPSVPREFILSEQWFVLNGKVSTP